MYPSGRVPTHLLQPSPPAYLIISSFFGRGSCICQFREGSPRGELWFSEDCQKNKIHPMYPFDNVDALSHVVWGPDHVLQLLPQAHQINSYVSGKGSCICQAGEGSFWGELWSSEDSPNIIIHLVYPSDNFDALSVDIWGLNDVLQPSPPAHLNISHFLGGGTAFVNYGKSCPEVSYCSLRMVIIS